MMEIRTRSERIERVIAWIIIAFLLGAFWWWAIRTVVQWME